ncbi:cobalt-precorrin-6A reductase [Allobranchiibius sp. GilTou73]|uniref:cobalt-precorrin-6A reductase n=1 Tax=unclassified Allobranchiibius TaxID=2649857 RepID=UPI001AA0F41B|nr:cobalt-precorrin-6A reductase [Allobranchiibius sp. GilTou73]MBO1765337.1 cobalt-precorrin-6A reductase [Allobranchiibius sp. GilTou38]UIJ35205.1 cobalt-precorrin-6A reductase [Allobranchiibius sp. GilTou73]
MFVLILGGTAEARDLADRLQGAGVPFVSSLAGRVARPRLPVGQVRIGGFGGAAGLAAYLRSSEVTHLVDATHPFAATMTQHAAQASADVGIPSIRLARPGWSGRPDAAGWHRCGSLSELCDVAGDIGARPFVTSGRQTLPAFRTWSDRDVLVRVVEPVQEPLPPRWTVVQDRGPYDIDGELALLRDQRIDVLVTKDSGGAYTSAKLDAAARLGVPVVVLSRPDAPAGLREVSCVDACVAALLG